MTQKYIKNINQFYGKEEFKKDVDQFISGGINSPEEIKAAIKLKEQEKWQNNNSALHIAQLSREIPNEAYGGDSIKMEQYEARIKKALMKRSGMTKDQAETEAAHQIRLVGDYKKLLS